MGKHIVKYWPNPHNYHLNPHNYHLKSLVEYLMALRLLPPLLVLLLCLLGVLLLAARPGALDALLVTALLLLLALKYAIQVDIHGQV